jgi:carbonic anhydrase/acetyltransferase-like protein (isoleucine patch superfamily)
MPSPRPPGPEIEMPAIYGRHSIISEDAQIGENTRIGNFVFIRDNTVIGKACSVGSYVDIEGDVRIGDFVSLQSGCYLTRGVVIEDRSVLRSSHDDAERQGHQPPPAFVGFRAARTAIVARGADWRRQRTLPRRDHRGKRPGRGRFSRDARRAGSMHRHGQPRPDRGAGARRPDHLADVHLAGTTGIRSVRRVAGNEIALIVRHE